MKVARYEVPGWHSEKQPVPERSEVVCQVFGVEFFTGEV
jgi:hypothetical protein